MSKQTVCLVTSHALRANQPQLFLLPLALLKISTYSLHGVNLSLLWLVIITIYFIESLTSTRNNTRIELNDMDMKFYLHTRIIHTTVRLQTKPNALS